MCWRSMKTYSRSTCQHDYEAYRDDENVSPLARLLSWTHNLIILNQSKRPEERQFKTALFERTVLNPPKVSPLVSQIHPNALGIFKDRYLVEFLGLPQAHAENIQKRLDKGGCFIDVKASFDPGELEAAGI